MADTTPDWAKDTSSAPDWAKETTTAAPKQDLYERVSGQLREALPVQEGRQQFFGLPILFQRRSISIDQLGFLLCLEFWL